MPFKRDLFTGELVEVPSDGGGRRIIARTSIPEGAIDPSRRKGSAWGRVWRGQSLGVHPDQAAEFSQAAKDAGTGAWYDEKGRVCADSEAALQREFGRRGYYDRNAGSRDQSYKGYEESVQRELAHNPSADWWHELRHG